MSRGRSQKEACKELGISVMTLHRWRKLSVPEISAEARNSMERGLTESSRESPIPHEEDAGQIDQLRLENSRLRRIVGDLLLEKMKIQEALDRVKK
jgi:hypothetical protein